MSEVLSRAGGMRWMSHVQKSDKGAPHPTVANAILVLQNDPDLVSLLAYDEFSHIFITLRAPPAICEEGPTLAGPYPRPTREEDYTAIQSWMQRVYAMKLSLQVTQQACTTVGIIHRRHPVREWLDTQAWDGTPRLETWLSLVYGCPQDDYHAAVGTKFLVAAVRRIRNPGCKFDYVPVFSGKQGIRKSSSLAVLFSSPWFKDDLHGDLGHKDAAQGLLGVWCVELAELQSLMRSSKEDTKAFMSRQQDRYRPSYSRLEVTRPRQCVFVGTTNDDQYLSDPTGNRRYWPVTCEGADIEWLHENRQQLWAEAAVLERSGEVTLWMDEEPIKKEAERQQTERLAEDPWQESVEAWLTQEYKTEVTMFDVLHFGIGIPKDRMVRATQNRAAAIMKNLGWERQTVWRDGRAKKVWLKVT